MAVKFRFGWSRTVLAVYLLLLAVTYILMRKGVAGEVFTGIVFSWQLLVMFLGLARLSTKPVALGIVLVFLGAFTMLPLFTDVFPGLSGLVSDKSFWIVVPIFVAAVILVSEFLRIRRRVARKKLLPAVQSGLGEDGTLYEKNVVFFTTLNRGRRGSVGRHCFSHCRQYGTGLVSLCPRGRNLCAGSKRHGRLIDCRHAPRLVCGDADVLSLRKIQRQKGGFSQGYLEVAADQWERYIRESNCKGTGLR